MLINYNNENQDSHVKFISYESSAYALCLGTLTLEVNGQTYTFDYAESYQKYEFWKNGLYAEIQDGVDCDWFVKRGFYQG